MAFHDERDRWYSSARAIGVTESEGERSICFTNTGKERKLVAASWDSVTNTQTLYNQKSTPFGA